MLGTAMVGTAAEPESSDSTSTGSILTLREDGALMCGSERLSENVVARSELLWALRDTAGSAPVPIQHASFQAWRHYHDGKADVPASELASVLEVSLFLDDPQSATQTSRKLATIIRCAYRRDLRSTVSTSNGTLCFPHHPTATPGPALTYVFSDIRDMTSASVSTIVPHLTLCESLACPAPFPSLAVTHYLDEDPGHLDLSPPRVPTHSRPLLHRLCTSIAPLLSSLPSLPTRLSSLTVPVTALRGSGQLPLLPLASLLTHVTFLRISPEPPQPAPTDGSPTNLSSSALHALLMNMSPASLRHISAPVPLSPCPAAAQVFDILSTFTGLTSLTLGLPEHPARSQFTAMASLPALRCLHLTHTPRAVLALGPVRLAPTLTRLHATGNGAATRHILASSALSFNNPLPQTLTDIGANPRACLPGCPVTAAENRTIKNKFEALTQIPRSSLVLPLGSTNPDNLPPSTLRTVRRLAVNCDDAEALLDRLKAAPHLRSLILYLPSISHALAAVSAAPLVGLLHLRIVLSQSISVNPRELTAMQAVAAAMLQSLPGLQTLEALHLADVSEEAVAPMGTVPQCIDGFPEAAADIGAQDAADDGVFGLLNSADQPRAETAVQPPRANECGAARYVPAASTLRAVRVSRCLLGKELRDALQAAVATGTLRVLSVLSSEAPSASACKFPDSAPSSHSLSFLPTLTSLRKLSVEGQQSVCMFAAALTPLHGLTALQLRGTEACSQAACECGSRLAQLSALQQLNLDVIWQGSNPLAAAYACAAAGGGACVTCAADPVADDDDSFAAVEAGFWVGIWGSVMELPLHRGCRASFRMGCSCVAEML